MPFVGQNVESCRILVGTRCDCLPTHHVTVTIISIAPIVQAFSLRSCQALACRNDPLTSHGTFRPGKGELQASVSLQLQAHARRQAHAFAPSFLAFLSDKKCCCNMSLKVSNIKQLVSNRGKFDEKAEDERRSSSSSFRFI